MSCYYLGWTFDLYTLTLTYKILTRLHFRNHKALEVDTWYGHGLGGVGVQCHGVTLICGRNIGLGV